MGNPFIHKICQIVIGSAFQRCRVSPNLCRLSILLKSFTNSDLPMLKISVSDTGVGCCLEEFHDMDCAKDNVSAEKWDGVLLVKTTSIQDTEVYDYCLNLKEKIASKRQIQLPPCSKNGGKFSGTEVSLYTSESVDALCVAVIHFLQKMLVLKIPNVAVELTIDPASINVSRCGTLFLANEGIHSSFSRSNIENLVSGLETHVLKHGSTQDKECQSCFPSRDHLKVGTGTTFNSESIRNKAQVTEAVIIITELPNPESPSCLTSCSTKTEVMYIQDFLPIPIPQQLLNALTSIDWKAYGLNLKSSAINEDGHPVLEWESLPPFSHIEIAIHCYHEQYPTPQMLKKVHFDKNLVKKAIKLAMDNLKEKYAGILLSAHAVKIQSYAPDLAKTIAGLIFSSNDMEFQGECLSLLGLQTEEAGKDRVEECIRDKITSVVGMNDRKQSRNREPAPFLFEDERIQDGGCLYGDEDEYDEEYDYMDL
ncbi:hypothetical protein ACHQM5_007155 [Ranunculus cassubicifolius]